MRIPLSCGPTRARERTNGWKVTQHGRWRGKRATMAVLALVRSGHGQIRLSIAGRCVCCAMQHALCQRWHHRREVGAAVHRQSPHRVSCTAHVASRAPSGCHDQSDGAKKPQGLRVGKARSVSGAHHSLNAACMHRKSTDGMHQVTRRCSMARRGKEGTGRLRIMTRATASSEQPHDGGPRSSRAG